MNFCVKCGKKGKFDENLCRECYLDGSPLPKGLEGLEVKICAYCGNYFKDNRWITHENLKGAIRKIISAKLDKKPKKIELIIPEHDAGPGLRVDFEAHLDFGEQEFVLNAPIKYTLCSHCGMKGSQYFEGVIQLRNSNKEVCDFIKKEAEAQASKGVFINKTEREGDGFDFYVTSNRFIQHISNAVRKKFGAEVTKSARLFSHDNLTSKHIYRLNVLIKLPKFKIGDGVSVDGDEYLIKKVGQKVELLNSKTGKKISMNYKDVERKF